jgi:hypothetical protein
MDVVLVHLGNGIPSHLFVAIDQFRIFNPQVPVWVLVNRSQVPYFEQFQESFSYHVTCVEDLPGDFSYLDKLIKQPNGSFYNSALKRLYYLQSFMESKRMGEVVHFENDVMIFVDLAVVGPAFRQVPHLGLTIGTARCAMTGFFYIKDAASLKTMLDYFDRRLAEPDLASRYGMDKLHEMYLLGLFANEVGEPQVIELPSLPFGTHAKGKEAFGGLFDPAAWGQYLGGLKDHGCVPGWKKETHFIGAELIRGTVDARMIQNGNGLLVPRVFVAQTGEEVALYSLHVHGKKLKRFYSRPGVFQPE